jgi:hypothetical protein
MAQGHVLKARGKKNVNLLRKEQMMQQDEHEQMRMYLRPH